MGLTYRVSLPGLTGQSSTQGPCLLDRPVKPGDDSAMWLKRGKALTRQQMSRVSRETLQAALTRAHRSIKSP
jgi:hypothetical protein